MIRRTAIFTSLGIALALSFGLSSFTAKASDLKEIRIGVNGDYNAQWITVNKLLAKEGLKVKLVKYSDYATPNRALNDGEVDLNAFQHKAFLENDIKPQRLQDRSHWRYPNNSDSSF